MKPLFNLAETGRRCPESVPLKFTAEINCSRYGITQNAVAMIRFRDNDTQKSTDYCVCRAVHLRALPNYMDGKRTCVTFAILKSYVKHLDARRFLHKAAKKQEVK